MYGIIKIILDAGERVNMIKGKILKITENTVYIGYEDGSLKEIPIESCEFEPRMGDYVEVYGDIAIKVEGSKESSPVKKSEAKKISLVSKINIFSSIVLFPISFSLLYDRGVILEATILSLFVVSLLLIVLNLILLIISSIKKNKVNKKSSITYLIIAIIILILSTVYVSNNVRPNSKKTVSQSTSKSSTSSSKSKSNSSSSQESSSSSKKSRTIPSVENKDVDMDKTKYKPLTSYDEWVHDELPRYMKIRIRGEVGQVADDPGGIIVRLILTELGENYGKIVSILIPTKYISRTIVYGDTLTFYGETNGTGNYQYQEGFITLPIMIAYMYEN